MTKIHLRKADLQKAIKSHSVSRQKCFSGVIVLVVLVLVGIIAILADRPPRPLSDSIPAEQFSAERALKYVLAIGKAPHPVGTAQHEVVRDSIVNALTQAGLHAEVRESTAVSQDLGVAGSVENIVVRLPGKETGEPVLLVAHYDSMPTSFGASDDGAGVATLLESARAIKLLPQTKRDIIFLFTDGEEVGLLGAEAFVTGGDQTANTGIVLNFDARGTGGPAMLFETSDKNGSLIKAFSHAARNPVANSLFYEIYKRLPNNTDFSVFKRSGYSGLNFAFIEGLVHYHTAEDNVSNLNLGSLQQEGDYALDLAMWFGNADQQDLKENNAVYFDVLGLILIRYSSTLEIVLTALAAVLLLGLTMQAISKGWVSAKAVLLGILVVAAALIAAFVGSFVADRLLETFARALPHVLAGELYSNGLYVASLSIFGVAISSMVFVWGDGRIGSHNLELAGLVFWFGVLLFASIFVPSAGHVWLWPLLFVLVGWNIVVAANIPYGDALLAVAVVPGVVLIAPMVHKIFTAFAIGSYSIVSVMLALFMALLVLPLSPTRMPRPWVLPVGLIAISACLLIAAILLSPPFDREHPRFDSTFYVEDADNGNALWVSYDDGLDSWDSQFFTVGARKEDLGNILPGNPRKFLQSTVQAIPFITPVVQVLGTTAIVGGRELHLRLTSKRNAPILSLSLPEDAVLKAWVNGKEISGRHTFQKFWTLQYYAVPAEGIDMVVDLKGSAQVQARVADISYGLPDGAMNGFKVRPESVIFSSARLSNTTIVAKSFGL